MKRFRRLLALALLALLLLPAALSACSKKSGDSPKLEHNILHFYCAEDTRTYFFLDGKKLSDTIAGNITKLGTVDGTQGFVTAATALYHIDGNGLLLIYPAAVTNAVLSLDGRFILFATAQKVLLYDHEARDYIQLPDIEAKSIASLVLSPDGSAAGVAAVTDDNRIISYVYSGGECSVYGEDRCIVAIADGAARSYYVEAPEGKTTGRLHFVQNGNDKLIAENASPYFETNRSLSEITFDVNEKTHVSRSGSSAKQLVDASVFSLRGEQYASQGGEAAATLVKNTDSLFDGVFYTNITGQDQNGTRYEQYNVYYINSSLSVSKLALGTDQFSVSADGKEILCIVDDGLYRVSAYAPKKPQLLTSSTYTFCANDDFSEIFFIDTTGNLYDYANGSFTNVSVSGVQLAKRMQDGTVLCYAPVESNGTLLWLKDGHADAIATNVSFFEVYDHCAMYLSDYDQSDGTYSLYTSESGVDFTLALEHAGISR